MTALGIHFLRTRRDAKSDGDMGFSTASVFNQNLQTAIYGRGSGGVDGGDGRDGVKKSPHESTKKRYLRSGKKAVLKVEGDKGVGRKAVAKKEVRRRRVQIAGKVSNDVAEKIIKRKCVEQRARV